MNIHPKVSASGLAGAVVLIAVWLLGQFHVTMPAEVASAFTIIVSFVAGYFTTDGSGNLVLPDK